MDLGARRRARRRARRARRRRVVGLESRPCSRTASCRSACATPRSWRIRSACSPGRRSPASSRCGLPIDAYSRSSTGSNLRTRGISFLATQDCFEPRATWTSKVEVRDEVEDDTLRTPCGGGEDEAAPCGGGEDQSPKCPQGGLAMPRKSTSSATLRQPHHAGSPLSGVWTPGADAHALLPQLIELIKITEHAVPARRHDRDRRPSALPKCMPTRLPSAS